MRMTRLVWCPADMTPKSDCRNRVRDFTPDNPTEGRGPLEPSAATAVVSPTTVALSGEPPFPRVAEVISGTRH